jgi:hypothetical protein
MSIRSMSRPPRAKIVALVRGLHVKPGFRGTEGHAKEAQEPFLSEQAERERPRIAERYASFVAHPRDGQIDTGVERCRRDTTDDDERSQRARLSAAV